MNLVEYTEFLVKSIVKEPDMVKVERFDTEDEGTMLEIIVRDSDMASVIGRNGKNASALRTLIQAKAYLLKEQRVKINIDSF